MCCVASSTVAELDASIVALPFSGGGLVRAQMYEESFSVLLPGDHPWTKQKQIQPEQMLDETLLLLGEGHCFRDQVLELCPAIDSERQRNLVQIEGGSLETLRHMVASGPASPCCSTRSTSTATTRAPSRCPFAAPVPSRTIALVWRDSFPRPKAIEVLRHAVPARVSPPDMSPPAALETIDITRLKGVGPRAAERLARLGLATLEDVLFHLPFRYEDRTRITPIGSLRPEQGVVIEGEVMAADVVFGKRRSLLCKVADGTGLVALRFYHFSAAQKNALGRRRIRVYGEPPTWRRLEFYHPGTSSARISHRWKSPDAGLPDHRGVSRSCCASRRPGPAMATDPCAGRADPPATADQSACRPGPGPSSCTTRNWTTRWTCCWTATTRR